MEPQESFSAEGATDDPERQHATEPHHERRQCRVPDREHRAIIIAGLQKSELPDVDESAVRWLTEGLLEAIARGEAVDPTALLFLLRRYTATDRDDLRDAVGEALALALAEPHTNATRAGWLTVFTEASLISDNIRLRTAATELRDDLRRGWHTVVTIEAATDGVEAYLISANAISARDLLADAIDELERTVGAVYRPGEGVGRFIGEPDRERGRLGDQIRAASALVTAFGLTGRLPYSMLAEELMKFAQRTLWDKAGGGFFDGPGPKPFVLNCEAARVFSRLEALHRDEEYRQVAVLATSSAYASDAEQTLASQRPGLRDRGLAAAAYGIVLTEWLHLRGDLK